MTSSRDTVLQSLKWKKHKVLDDGFVCLVDVMGDDSSVAQAARVSYGSGTKQVNDDRNLIRYLLRHRHTTPFEMCELKFLVRVPMDTWRQLVRHRTANINEYSTRYSEAIDSQQTTSEEEWRLQTASNKQGSEGYLDASSGAVESQKELDFHTQARDLYNHRLSLGIAREQARKDLLLSTYTEAYWKVDLHNLLHFLALRMDSHAQLEIRQYAQTIGEQIVRPLFPIVWEAFRDYRTNAMYLTWHEVEILRSVLSVAAYSKDKVLKIVDEHLTNKRERKEAFDKLGKLIHMVDEQ